MKHQNKFQQKSIVFDLGNIIDLAKNEVSYNQQTFKEYQDDKNGGAYLCMNVMYVA